jgi:hypothetical protein
LNSGICFSTVSSVAARVQASEVNRIQRAHRDLHLAVEALTEISA